MVNFLFFELIFILYILELFFQKRLLIFCRFMLSHQFLILFFHLFHLVFVLFLENFKFFLNIIEISIVYRSLLIIILILELFAPLLFEFVEDLSYSGIFFSYETQIFRICCLELNNLLCQRKKFLVFEWDLFHEFGDLICRVFDCLLIRRYNNVLFG